MNPKNIVNWIYDIRQAVINGGLVSNAKLVYTDTTGVYKFCPDNCSEDLTYNADSAPITDTYTDPITGYQFRQTLTYTAGLLTHVSGWVKL